MPSSFTARAGRPGRPGRTPAEWVRLAVAASYGTAVLVTTAIVLGYDLFADDPGFIGVWLILITSPLSMVGMYLLEFLGDMPDALGTFVLYAMTTVSGALQTWLLWPPRRPRREAEAPPA
ncbi:SCO4225 family membrane protein [Actinomadura verrucosospora]|uniref:Uncharacterized protein n=1 Tax=Actinomadura verrucosospora TaxID=46165 RepID=A0A7D3ZFX1_ACTVE|nr:hypothetical protein [Actinomadura verrucosospora]QKG22497.1 hypothetical protein ACTIVE_4137 [Actinomadura verrucosospora]